MEQSGFNFRERERKGCRGKNSGVINWVKRRRKIEGLQHKRDKFGNGRGKTMKTLKKGTEMNRHKLNG